MHQTITADRYEVAPVAYSVSSDSCGLERVGRQVMVYVVAIGTQKFFDLSSCLVGAPSIGRFVGDERDTPRRF
jgi:hypothetical protein